MLNLYFNLYILSDVIPTTVTTIKVTTIQHPHMIRAYEIQQHADKLDRIQRKLLSFMKTEDYLRGKYNVQNPKVDDVSFMYTPCYVYSLFYLYCLYLNYN